MYAQYISGSADSGVSSFLLVYLYKLYDGSLNESSCTIAIPNPTIMAVQVHYFRYRYTYQASFQWGRNMSQFLVLIIYPEVRKNFLGMSENVGGTSPIQKSNGWSSWMFPVFVGGLISTENEECSMIYGAWCIHPSTCTTWVAASLWSLISLTGLTSNEIGSERVNLPHITYWRLYLHT